MEQQVELPPAYYSLLYRQLSESVEFRQILEDRLLEIGETLDFLDELADLYDNAFSGPFVVLAPAHAIFASWIMAPLRSLGSSDNFQSELNRQVHAAFPQEVLQSNGNRPYILAWVLCAVQGKLQNDLPLTFPIEFTDPSVHAAYRGLSEHLSLVLANESGRSELMMNSILWRVSGILEGMVASLTNERYSPKQSYSALEKSNNQVLGPMRLTGWQTYNEVGDYRNVLTHMSGQDNVTFLQASEKGRQEESLQDYVSLARMIARFVAAETNTILLSIPLPGEAAWDNLRWDVSFEA